MRERPEIPSLIVWTLGGKNVYVEGSWDNWKSRKAMQKSGKDHSLLLVLPSGVYRYRCVVDGERRCLPDLPCETDAMGNAVNLLDVNDFVPESVESVVEFEPPLSLDSSYSFQAPEDKDFAKEPPALPAQLHLGVLNSQNSEESCARPQHIVLNHLFIEKIPNFKFNFVDSLSSD
ncbi:SNF1-related protein kinase regulatory subunit beta-1 [Zea mays]|nr:SNF1-related protein kinase regulatory subunit beta-1 [Zea mays]|eukprot:XP_020406512.1 SNF1-related protein kinase regulatory subunit beta-1 [Zea mays]